MDDLLVWIVCAVVLAAAFLIALGVAQLCVLLDLLAAARDIRKHLEEPSAAAQDPQVGAAAPTPPSAPHTPADAGIWEVLSHPHDPDTYRHGLVREGSAAWQKAYDTPGQYLRRTSGEREIVEGAQ